MVASLSLALLHYPYKDYMSVLNLKLRTETISSSRYIP